MTSSSSQLLLPNPIGGGYFHFWSKNRHQKYKKRAILHTLRANGEESSPPPAPPAYATDCLELMFLTSLNAHFL